MENYDPKKLAEACGIHAGDGYARNDSSGRREIDISGSMEEKEYYDEHVGPLFADIFNLDVECRKFPNRSTYGFRITDAEAVGMFIEELGFPNGKKNEVEVPNFIKNSSEEVISRFLRGIYDTDGHLSFYKRYADYNSEWERTYHHYPRLSLDNTSKILIDQSAELLDRLDIGYFKRKIERKNENWRDQHKLNSVGEERLEKFMMKVGFRNPVKLTHYKVWKEFGYCPTKTSLKERYKILSEELNPERFYEKGP